MFTVREFATNHHILFNKNVVSSILCTKILMTSPQIMRLTNFPHETEWRIIKKVETLLGDELRFIL